VLRAVVNDIERRFRITHTTVQVEVGRMRTERHVLYRPQSARGPVSSHKGVMRVPLNARPTCVEVAHPFGILPFA
jgi:hypothetical protein